MNISQAPIKRALRLAVVCLTGLVLGLTSTFAQNGATGTLVGRVTDASSRLSLAGAKVSVANTALETYTNQQGNYELADVPAGIVTLNVAYVGYTNLSINATVKAGETVEANAVFNEEVVTMNAFTIVGDTVGSARAINLQRAAPTLTDIVASDAIGQLPDKNVAEALERIPGVDLYRDKGEGRFIEIRGLDPVYVGVDFNGIRASSTDKGTREVVLDVISSDMIADLEVTKVGTPDMDADSMGGSVNVKTRSGFDQQGAQAMVSGGTDWSNQEDRHGGYNASAYYGNQYDGGKLGVFLGFVTDYRPFTVYNTEASDSSLYANDWQPVTINGQTSSIFTGQDFRHYDVARYRHGIDGSLDYKFSDASSVYFRYTMSYYTERDNYWVTEIPWGQANSAIEALTNTSATVVIPAKVLLKEGVGVTNSKISTSLVGGWDKTFGPFTNNFEAGYTLGKYTRPTITMALANTSAMTMAYSFSDPWHDAVGQVAGPNFNDPSQYAFSTKSKFTNTIAGTHEKTVKDDLKRDFQIDGMPAFLKVGVEYRDKNTFEANSSNKITSLPWSLTNEIASGPDTQYSFGGFQGFRILPQADSMFYNLQNSVPMTFSQDTGSYMSSEKIGAGYIMGGLTVGKLKIVAGARVEATNFYILGWQEDVTTSVFSQVAYNKNYANLLPDVVLTYTVTPRTIVRASWTTSIARPDYADTDPGRSVDDVNHLVTQGNPELPALTAMNYDVSVEHYLSSLGVVSGAFFYKSINNFAYEGTSGVDPSTGYALNSYFTAPSAWIYGFEFAWKHRFSFLPAPLDGLGIDANITLGDSQVQYPTRPGEDLPFVGLAKQLANVALTYYKNGLKLSLGAQHHSNRMEVDSALGTTAALDFYENAFTEIDFGSSYTFRQHWQVYFNAANINNAPLREYHNGPAGWKQMSQYEQYGPGLEAGVRWIY